MQNFNSSYQYTGFLSLLLQKKTGLLFLLLAMAFAGFAQNEGRLVIPLGNDWLTAANDTDPDAFNGFEKNSFRTGSWVKTDVPHNWDAYEGYRRMRHGNRHGYAWYRKSFQLPSIKKDKRYFLFFEGVGSYATVWVNGKKAGYHAGGRTSFTIDITEFVNRNGQANLLAVRADHPANIRDLPWVCGGCSDERGFSEGSQPMGIFRPVSLVITGATRIEPFGVHIWNDTTVNERSAILYTETEIKNYTSSSARVRLVNRLKDRNGKIVAESSSSQQVNKGQTIFIRQELPKIEQPQLWSPGRPYLYQLVSDLVVNGRTVDRLITTYGIRSISWPIGRAGDDKRFFVNGKPVFINGIAEYEHQLGNSHAFSDEQIRTRVQQIKAAGFNAFRDAHQPHNLRYGKYWDSAGILCWTQMAAHIWFDSPEFRKNFKQLLTDWVKERRNNPSVVLWGLENESKLPASFTRECTELIRKLDPTASSQRKVTTCNGGEGTDWDVPQNWTGTYGGDPSTYGADLQRQVLVGEYGAWRTLDLHTEGPLQQNGIYSEDRMAQLMEMKLRLADSVKNKTSGHFMWLFTSHDNPGRVQGGEGYRELDRIGPVNYKGLLTPWEEPLDVFYMYRSNFAPAESEPMVYIVSHTWPDRWTKPGLKDSVIVYSNCDEVELFNDLSGHSLGKRKRAGVGTHFQWDKVNVQYNVLYAVGYVNGKMAAQDTILLPHLLEAPGFDKLFAGAKALTAPQTGYHYIYRVNCGGPDYTDVNGNLWMADRQKKQGHEWGSVSWTENFPGMPAFFASQRRTQDPVRGTRDWKLFQTFRYGKDQLRFHFPLPDGEYLVELYFIEPWLGTGGGMDCRGWRLFDVAVNEKTVLKNFDIWKEAGHDGALKKTLKAKVSGGEMVISFPRVASGQALISAIAIASTSSKIKPARGYSLIRDLDFSSNGKVEKASVQRWMDAGDKQFEDGATAFTQLPPQLYGAEWIRLQGPVQSKQSYLEFTLSDSADVFIGLDPQGEKPSWLLNYEDTRSQIRNNGGRLFEVYRRRYGRNARVQLGPDGNLSAGHYIIAAVPVSGIEPAYDLKPVTSYKAVNARFGGPAISKGMIDGKERIIFKSPSAENFIEWDISVGVADTYSLTISYNNPHEKTLEGRLQLMAADGTLMKEERVEFTTTRPGKSNYINSSTGSMINAGHYRVRLSADKAPGLSVNALDVQ